MTLYSVGLLNVNRKEPVGPRAAAIAAEIDQLDLNLLGLTEASDADRAEDRILQAMTPNLANDWRVTSDYVNCPTAARGDLFDSFKIAGSAQRAIKMRTRPHVRYRYGSAAALRDKSTGLEFVLVNVHLSNNGESSHAASDRILQAQDAVAELRKWGALSKTPGAFSAGDLPVVWVGDFNAVEVAPKGPAGVLVKASMVDVVRALKKPIPIDRAFAYGFDPDSWHVRTVSARITDHKRICRVRLRSITDPGEKPATPLDTLFQIHGSIAALKVSSFERARVGSYPSRYVGVVQDWLGVTVDCAWNGQDQAALDAWRHKEFPTWPPSDYKGAAGVVSLTRLAQHAKEAGKKTYRVVK